MALVAGSVAIEADGGVLLIIVLVGKSYASTNRDLCTDDTVAAVEARGEHVHASALAVGDTFSSSQELADDAFHGTTSHECEAVASVCGDDIVFPGDGMLDAGSNGFLTGGQMAEATYFLFLVKSIGGHFHSSAKILCESPFMSILKAGCNHRMDTISLYIVFNSFLVVAR